jgi:hypothetical protein
LPSAVKNDFRFLHFSLIVSAMQHCCQEGLVNGYPKEQKRLAAPRPIIFALKCIKTLYTILHWNITYTKLIV